MTQQLFGLYARVFLQRPGLTLLVVSLIVGFLALQARHFELDASADALVLEGDPALEYFREINDRYQAEDFLLITYRPHDDLLADSTLAAIDRLRAELAALPGVSSVVTLLDVPLLDSPRVSLNQLADGEVRSLRDEAVDRELVRRELTSSPIYLHLLSSADAKTTAIQVNLERDERYFRLLERREKLRERRERGDLDSAGVKELAAAEATFRDYATAFNERQSELVEQVRAVVDGHRDHAEMFVGGVPMIAADMIAFVERDLRTFGAGIVLFIVLLMSVIFRRLAWVVLPLLSCAFSALFMLGLLSLLDWRMTVISSNFVALLLIITLAINVHLVVRYRELLNANPDAPQRELVLRATGLMARPCVYTALTTIVAFASLVISGIRPVIDFGWMMTIGVAAALVITFLVLPTGLLLLPKPRPGRSGGEMRGLTPQLARITEHHGRKVLVLSALVLLASIWGMSRLEVENRFIDYFHQGTEIYQGMVVIDRELGGTIPLEVIINARDADREQEIFEDDPFADDFADDFAVNGGQEPSVWFTRAGLSRLEQVHDYLDAQPETGKVLSLATLYKVLREILDGSVDDITLALIRNQLPEDIADIMVRPYLDEAIDQARFTIRVMETSEDLRRADLLQRIRHDLVHELGFEPEQFELTGMLVLYNNMLQSLFRSQILTLTAVFVAIMLMFMVLFRSLSLSLLAIVPNLLAAGAVLGAMGIAGLPLDIMTITIAAITVGIGVDDTIHYVHRFREEFARDRDYVAAMHRAHGSIGKAMYYTSVTIIVGFSILALSNFMPSIYFGLLTATAMLVALLGALLLLPRLLITFRPLGPQRRS